MYQRLVKLQTIHSLFVNTKFEKTTVFLVDSYRLGYEFTITVDIAVMNLVEM